MTVKDDRIARMRAELADLQEYLRQNWLKRGLPAEWNGLAASNPIAPHKTRVTVRLDRDMVRWFRKLGPGYQGAMNRVLRIYWLGILSGQVQNHPSDPTEQMLWDNVERWENAEHLKMMERHTNLLSRAGPDYTFGGDDAGGGLADGEAQ